MAADRPLVRAPDVSGQCDRQANADACPECDLERCSAAQPTSLSAAGAQKSVRRPSKIAAAPMRGAAPVSQLAEEADSNPAQCQFESDRGHHLRGPRRRVAQSAPAASATASRHRGRQPDHVDEPVHQVRLPAQHHRHSGVSEPTGEQLPLVADRIETRRSPGRSAACPERSSASRIEARGSPRSTRRRHVVVARTSRCPHRSAGNPPRTGRGTRVRLTASHGG